MTKGPRDKRMTIDEVVGDARGRHHPRHRRLGAAAQADGAGPRDPPLRPQGPHPGQLGRRRRRPAGPRPARSRSSSTRFVSLDSVPLEPQLPAARARTAPSPRSSSSTRGCSRPACAPPPSGCRSCRCAAGLGSDVLVNNPWIRTVTSPYADGQELVAVPALELDVALVHLNRADQHGNATYLGPDPYFDDLFCMAADRAYVSCEQVVDTAGLTVDAPVAAAADQPDDGHGVVETPNGAHFTTCTPDYERDETFQRAYAAAAGGSRRGVGGVRGAVPVRRRGGLPGRRRGPSRRSSHDRGHPRGRLRRRDRRRVRRRRRDLRQPDGAAADARASGSAG